MVKLNRLLGGVSMSKKYVDEIRNLVKQGLSKETFNAELLKFHPYELSESLLLMNDDERLLIYKRLSAAEIAESFGYLEEDEAINLFNGMKPKYIANILQELEMDDAVDIIEHMPEKEQAAYLTLMDENHRNKIKNLLKYTEDTAGSIMTTEYIAVSVKDSVEKAMKKMISQAVDAGTIYTIYVIDSSGVLVGTMSLRELILARKGELVSEIMNKRLISVKAGADQEDVADLIQDYDFPSIPVVDHLNRILGVVTVDDIIDVIEEEALEDYSKFAGISDAEIDHETETIWMSSKKRIPWLLVLSVLGFFTSMLLANFEDTLSKVTSLALFIPMILGMAGNTGTQSLAVTVRGLNEGEFNTGGKIRKHLVREVGTGLLNGILIGAILFVVTYLFLLLTNTSNAITITQVVSLSIVSSLTVATFSGALIPIIINSFKVDPAIASGPFVTMIIDIMALTVYFGLAQILFKALL